MTLLAQKLNDLTQTHQAESTTGAIETNVSGVSLFWVKESVPRAPLVYNAGLVIIGQGHKIGYLGSRQFRYDSDSYLVLGVPVPFECETHTTPDEPLLGMRIDIDLTKLHELISKFGGRINFEKHTRKADVHPGLEPADIDENMYQATMRLLDCLSDPIDSKVLGAGAVDELLYRVLRGEKGHVLYNLTQHQTPYAAVSRSLERIHSEYNSTLTVEELARDSAMSVSSFHRAFRKVTGDSPLQYLKKIRLDKAKGLLVHDKMRVNKVAFEVGYESPSQFSREFKRYFTVAPSEAETLAYN